MTPADPATIRAIQRRDWTPPPAIERGPHSGDSIVADLLKKLPRAD